MTHNLCGCKECGGIEERLRAVRERAFASLIQRAEARGPFYERLRGEIALAKRVCQPEEGWRVTPISALVHPCVRDKADALWCHAHLADYGDGDLWCQAITSLVDRLDGARR